MHSLLGNNRSGGDCEAEKLHSKARQKYFFKKKLQKNLPEIKKVVPLQSFRLEKNSKGNKKTNIEIIAIDEVVQESEMILCQFTKI